MNLQAIANPCAAVVNPNFAGTVRFASGQTNEGDAILTGSIAATTLTVSAVAFGSLAVNSVLTSTLIESPTLIEAQLSGTPGGIGTYRVSIGQTVVSGPIVATGTGKRVPAYVNATNITMQFQAVAGDDLKHIDGLNIQGIYRAVYLNGRIEGVDRPAMTGGDLLLVPTGMSATPPLNDIWLIKEVLEPWDTGGWCKVIAVLQSP